MKKETLIKNLVYLNTKQQMLDQLKKAQVRRVATQIRDRLRDMPSLDRDTVGDELRLMFSQDMPGEVAFADICHEVCLQMPELTPSVFFPAPTEEENASVVSYLKSAHSDRAYRIFASHIPDASIVAAASSYNCCEDVSTGKAAYCILPIHTSKDGILATFCALAEQYDLSVYAVAEVPSPQTEERTVFALLKRRCEWNRRKTFLALGIPEEIFGNCGRILCDLGVLGAEVLRISAIQTSDGRRSICLIVLNIANADLSAILLYLEVAAKSHITLGLFEKWMDADREAYPDAWTGETPQK